MVSKQKDKMEETASGDAATASGGFETTTEAFATTRTGKRSGEQQHGGEPLLGAS